MTTIVAGILFAVPVLALAGALVLVSRSMREALRGDSKDLRHLRAERQKLIKELLDSVGYPGMRETRQELLRDIDQRIKATERAIADRRKNSEADAHLAGLLRSRKRAVNAMGRQLRQGYPSIAEGYQPIIRDLDRQIEKHTRIKADTSLEQTR